MVGNSSLMEGLDHIMTSCDISVSTFKGLHETVSVTMKVNASGYWRMLGTLMMPML